MPSDEITKLIELAKQAGAKEERQRWNVNMPDWKYIFSRSCQRAHPHEEMNDECQEITKRLRAIRSRKINSHEIAEDCPYKDLTNMKTQYVIDQNKQKVEGFIMRSGDQICLSYGGAIRWMTCAELFNIMHDC